MTFVDLLRWIAVLPGAILGVLLVMFPIHWFVVWIHMPDGSGDSSFFALIPAEMMERLGYAFFTPFIMIYTGSYIAPKGKFETGIVMAVLWGVAIGASLVIVQSRWNYEAWGLLRIGLAVLIGIAGVSVGLIQSQKLSRPTLTTLQKAPQPS